MIRRRVPWVIMYGRRKATAASLIHSRRFATATTGKTPPPLPVQALDHVCVCVSDVAAAIDWYTSVLSLRQQYEDDPNFYPTDKTSPAFLEPGLALLPLPPETPPLPHHQGAHFALRVDAATFAAAKHGGLEARLSKKSATSASSSSNLPRVVYHDYGPQSSLFFHDPDANVVELTTWEAEVHDDDSLRSLERLRFATLDNMSLRTLTASNPLYTSSYADAPFDELPWWAFLWPGGNAVAKHVLANPDIVKGKTVLDFACGGGVGTLVALASNAELIVANDISPLCLEATRLNLEENGWQEHQINDRVAFLCDDIVGSSNNKIPDVVLAGDVLYDDELARRVFPWFQDMAAAGAQVLVGDPGRWVLQEGTYDACLRKVAEHALDPQVRDEHHGYHTGNVWEVLARDSTRHACN